LDRNFLGVGYHFLINSYGKLKILREEKYRGVDCDQSAICICFEGSLSSVQKEKFREIILRISKEYHSLEAVIISEPLKAKCYFAR